MQGIQSKKICHENILDFNAEAKRSFLQLSLLQKHSIASCYANKIEEKEVKKIVWDDVLFDTRHAIAELNKFFKTY